MFIEVLAAIGLTFILKQGRIFDKIRSFLILKFSCLKELFDCAMCLGFWTGLFISIIVGNTFINCFIFALAISFLCFITQQILKVIGKLYNLL